MTDRVELWEQLSEELVASDPAITRSTMMGLPCLRLDGAFFASLDKQNGHLIVKLAADDVSTRVASGEGKSFAPAGKVFREWLAIDDDSESVWRAALDDALAFARDSMRR
jgi:hypothetical protein